MIVSDALLRVVPFHTESFFCKKKLWGKQSLTPPSHINQSRHFSNHQYISIAPIHFEENMYCTSFFLFLRQRKTTFLWRNAILKVPSWLQAHNLNEMELLICQLCVHDRHPLAKWICTNQGNTLRNLGVLHIVQCTRMRTRSCYFLLLCLRGMSKHAKGPFQVVKQSLNLEIRKPPLQQRRAKATCS